MMPEDLGDAVILEGYCQCGCGGKLQRAKYTCLRDGIVKGEFNRFLPKHCKGKLHPRWRGGRRKRPSGYIQVQCHEHPRATDGYIFEHILIAERALGKYLPPKAEIHHINEKKSDNRSENLVICQDTAYHILLHQRMRAYMATGDPNQRKCPFCKCWDNTKNMYCRSRKNGKRTNITYMHRECNNKYQREYRLRQKVKD